MNENHVLFTPEDEALIPIDVLLRHGNYGGDNETRLIMRAMARKLLALGSNKMNPVDVDKWLDQPVNMMRVNTRIQTVLTNESFRNIRDVFESGSDALLRCNGFGKGCAYELETLFAEYGLLWKAEPSDAPQYKPSDTTTVTVSVELFTRLVQAAEANLAAFEKAHGRFATRPPKAVEHARLTKLVDEARAALDAVTGAVSA